MKLSQLGLESNMASPEVLPSQQTSRMQGAVRRLKDGYGFIAGDDGTDYFFHWTGMEATGPNFKELSVLQRVEYNLVAGGPRGPRAICVRVLG